MKTQARLVEITQIEVIPNNPRNISTNGGNYNETIGRDSIGRDSITKNVKNITIGNKKVEINPNDIAETFDEFRDILTQSIAQTSNVLEAISEFVKELTEELRKQPEVKYCFDVDENISEQELVNKIFVDLLNKTYEQINVIHPTTSIIYEQIEKINNYRNLTYIENFEDNGNGEYDMFYKKYNIHLFQDQYKWWHYRIVRNNLSLFETSKNRSRNIYYAIGRAVVQIENEIESNWRNNMSNPE